ncbi:hypothetical protein RCU73_22930, partial [Escherichia marmotae]|nr:hypothetical protein [Escherichia marmotae]
MIDLPDIKPSTPVSVFERDKHLNSKIIFSIKNVSRAVGMTSSFIKKVCGKKDFLTAKDVLQLLDQDSFKETLVPRSKVIDYLFKLEG